MSIKEATILSVNQSILEELSVEELEEKVELSPIATLDLLVTRVDLLDPSLVADCGCNLQCGSFCNGNSSLQDDWLTQVKWPVETLKTGR